MRGSVVTNTKNRSFENPGPGRKKRTFPCFLSYSFFIAVVVVVAVVRVIEKKPNTLSF